MADGPASEIRDGELLAAVDLGSNSFHLVVARYEHGELRVIDRRTIPDNHPLDKRRHVERHLPMR